MIQAKTILTDAHSKSIRESSFSNIALHSCQLLSGFLFPKYWKFDKTVLRMVLVLLGIDWSRVGSPPWLQEDSPQSRGPRDYHPSRQSGMEGVGVSAHWTACDPPFALHGYRCDLLRVRKEPEGSFCLCFIPWGWTTLKPQQTYMITNVVLIDLQRRHFRSLSPQETISTLKTLQYILVLLKQTCNSYGKKKHPLCPGLSDKLVDQLWKSQVKLEVLLLTSSRQLVNFLPAPLKQALEYNSCLPSSKAIGKS